MVNIENYEEELKKMIFDRIYEIQDKNQELIANARRMGKKVGIDAELGNIARTATSKLIADIVPQFKNAGLKFYSNSIVSQAVYEQIIGYIVQGQEILRKCNDSLNPNENARISQKGDKESEKPQVALKPSTTLSRFLANLRNIFTMNKGQKKTISPESIEVVKRYISEYEDLDKKLWKYNLRDNIIPALTQLICPKDGLIYLARSVPALVDEEIAPVLQQLGLGDLIPQLEDSLVVEYTNNEEGRVERCLSQEEMDLYVPNFEKYRNEKKRDGGGEKQEQQIDDNKQTSMKKIMPEVAVAPEGIEPGED